MGNRNDVTAFAGWVVLAAVVVFIVAVLAAGCYVGAQLGDALSQVHLVAVR